MDSVGESVEPSVMMEEKGPLAPMAPATRLPPIYRRKKMQIHTPNIAACTCIHDVLILCIAIYGIKFGELALTVGIGEI